MLLPARATALSQDSTRMYSRKFAGVTITPASYSKQGIVAVVGVSKVEWVREIATKPE
jgi:hypothetical protein